MACIVWCKCLWKPWSGKMASNAWCKCLWKLHCDYTVTTVTLFQVYVKSSMYCDTVALLLSIVYNTAIIENYTNLNECLWKLHYDLRWWQSPCFKCVKSSIYCDTVALFLSIVYNITIIENYMNLNDANACENYIAIYCDDSRLVSRVCEIINVLRHSRLVFVDCL